MNGVTSLLTPEGNLLSVAADANGAASLTGYLDGQWLAERYVDGDAPFDGGGCGGGSFATAAVGRVGEAHRAALLGGRRWS